CHQQQAGAEHGTDFQLVRMGQRDRPECQANRCHPEVSAELRVLGTVRPHRQPAGVQRSRLGYQLRHELPREIARRAHDWCLDPPRYPKASTEPNGDTTDLTYDEVGQLAVTTAPTVNTETNGGTPRPTHPVAMVGYDTFGAATQASDPNGNVATTAYDADGRS